MFSLRWLRTNKLPDSTLQDWEDVHQKDLAYLAQRRADRTEKPREATSEEAA